MFLNNISSLDVSHLTLAIKKANQLTPRISAKITANAGCMTPDTTEAKHPAKMYGHSVLFKLNRRVIFGSGKSSSTYNINTSKI